MKNPRDIILRPVVSEKSYALLDHNVYTFVVAPDANKIEIKQAVEKLLGARVSEVRTANAHGTMKRQGRFQGRRSDWKKAYVKLREGAKLPDFLEGA